MPQGRAGAQLLLGRSSANATAELADGDELHLVNEMAMPASGPSLFLRGNPCAYRVVMLGEPTPSPAAAPAPVASAVPMAAVVTSAVPVAPMPVTAAAEAPATAAAEAL